MIEGYKRYNDPRDTSGCGLVGFINRDGKRVDGSNIIKSLCLMKDRCNGLGAGFAAYGIYPDMADYYAIHVMMDKPEVKPHVEHVLIKFFNVHREEEIPTRQNPYIKDPPIFWRYFVEPKNECLLQGEEQDGLVVRAVMSVNDNVSGAYVISSGKNMGAFKGVGEPADIADFFNIEDYKAYIWMGHTRFPTNTPGWWGGAHPFTILDWAIVHNGEITSYGTNRAFLEMYGYKCTLLTDTEVVAYALDYLLRQQKMPLRAAFYALASPFWKDIDMEFAEDREFSEALKAIRIQYGPLLLNGPFAILFGWRNGLVGFNDRIKLRPLFAGEKDETLYMASEEATIREICAKPDRLWMPRAGEPVIGM
ncbi:MAG: glutamine amidotransferase family protein, partial [Nitrospirota bacterium]